jgi:hypothetical protein
MSLFDLCPLPDDLTVIPKQVCPENLGQLVKIAFWQKGVVPFTDITILTAAGWTAATAADTPVVVTNYISNLAIPNSAKVEVTADTNINAMPELQRGGIVNVTGMSRSINAAVRRAMKALAPYSQIQPGVTELVCAFINSDNQVIWDSVSTDKGFEVFNIFTSDTDANAQLGALNQTASDFYLKYGWSDNLKIGQAAFDLLNTYPAA